MIRRIIWGVIATAMLATAGAAAVVAASFALYEWLKTDMGLGPSGAAATVAGGLALALLIGGMITMAVARGPKKKEESVVDRVINGLKERPIMSAAAAVAAIAVAVRNPAVVASVLAAFLGTQSNSNRR